jgi:hypothetical protein
MHCLSDLPSPMSKNFQLGEGPGHVLLAGVRIGVADVGDQLAGHRYRGVIGMLVSVGESAVPGHRARRFALIIFHFVAGWKACHLSMTAELGKVQA